MVSREHEGGAAQAGYGSAGEQPERPVVPWGPKAPAAPPRQSGGAAALPQRGSSLLAQWRKTPGVRGQAPAEDTQSDRGWCGPD